MNLDLRKRAIKAIDDTLAIYPELAWFRLRDDIKEALLKCLLDEIQKPMKDDPKL